MKDSAVQYVDEDHVDEIGQAFPQLTPKIYLHH